MWLILFAVIADSLKQSLDPFLYNSSYEHVRMDRTPIVNCLIRLKCLSFIFQDYLSWLCNIRQFENRALHIAGCFCSYSKALWKRFGPVLAHLVIHLNAWFGTLRYPMHLRKKSSRMKQTPRSQNLKPTNAVAKPNKIHQAQNKQISQLSLIGLACLLNLHLPSRNVTTLA